MIEITFEVLKIKFRNENTGYTVMEAKILTHPDDVEIPTAQRILFGHFRAIHKNDEFAAEGLWVDAGKYGYQFKVLANKLIYPETGKGMIHFLTRSVKDVGPIIANRLVETFKENTFNVIINSPDELMKVKGMTEKRKDAIYKSVFYHKEFEEVALYMLSLGLTHIETSKVYEEMGYASISKVTKNPYILMKYKGFSFKTADKVSMNLKYEKDDYRRVFHGLLHFLEYRMSNRGDMFTYVEDIYSSLGAHLNKHGGYEEEVEFEREEIDKQLARLLKYDRIRIEDYNGRQCVYVKYFYQAEEAIVESIKERLNSMNQWICHPDDLSNYLTEQKEAKKLSLAENQRKAIEMALFNKFSILSGGPGTGKTHTINAILNTIDNFAPDAIIKLCAPTGRAAKRMTEMTGRPAETIHRLVQIFGGEDSNPEGESFEEVDADFLIIDESSMIDAHVFHVLLQAVTVRTRILLVGDFNQLPSVGPGLILRDLMESKRVPVIILNEIFRQAQDSQIVTNAYTLIHGGNVSELTFDEKKRDFLFGEEKDVEKIIGMTLNVITKALSQGNKLDDIQVLSVLNGGDLGVKELNRRIQNKFNPKSSRKKSVEVSADFVLREGDRVMQTKNNYDIEVFNGEVGKVDKIQVVTVDGENVFELIVDYGDREVTYGEETIEELVLAYAMSVHKSQGSEFKYVIMPIHRSLKVLLNQNIIYTAWTRAKEKVSMIGVKDELSDGMKRQENTIRNSMIKYKLQRK